MDKKQFLFVTWEGGGNLPPVLGMARRLADRGHRVRVLTEPCLEETVERLGASCIPFRRHFTRSDRAEVLLKDYDSKSPKPALDSLLFGPMAITAEETQAALEAEPTDVLLTDCLMPGAIIPAEAMGVPTVILNHMPEHLPGPNRPPGVMGIAPGTSLPGKWRDRLISRLFRWQMNRYLPLVNELRRHYGLEPLGDVLDLYHGADRRFIQTCRGFDYPIEPAPENVRYTGPVLDDPDYPGSWQNPWPSDDDRPLVVVSFSTTFQNQREVMERCMEALAELPVRALVTLGPAMAKAHFSPAEHVCLESFVPHSQVFPQADLVITHGGHGTLMRALAHELPVLCVPMGRDQHDNAIKVVRSGLGLKVSPKSSPAKIRRAVQRLLTEKAFRKQCVRMGKMIRRDKEQEVALQELEHLAGLGNPVSRAKTVV